MKEYCIYFLKKDNVIIYIGMTNNIKRRLTEHGRDFYDSCRVIKCSSKAEAAKYELRWIKFFKPDFNKNKHPQKQVISLKLERGMINILRAGARKKEWTLSYYIESIIKNHVRKNRLLSNQKVA